jgi:hypothetical protein
MLEVYEKADRLKAHFGPDFEAFFYRPGVDRVIKSELLPFLSSKPKDYLAFLDIDHWSEKHPFNFPGPFYTGESDSCGTGEPDAPDNVLFDDYTREYLFRQPRDYAEFICVLDAAAVEVFESYSSNGNEHWTYALCKDWWKSREEIITKQRDPEFIVTNGPDRAELYAAYLAGPAETDLRKYCYFLENGTYPPDGVALPEL